MFDFLISFPVKRLASRRRSYMAKPRFYTAVLPSNLS